MPVGDILKAKQGTMTNQDIATMMLQEYRAMRAAQISGDRAKARDIGREINKLAECLQ